MQKKTSSLHREIEKPSMQQVAWGEEKFVITKIIPKCMPYAKTLIDYQRSTWALLW
jgi:hypothetical protein